MDYFDSLVSSLVYSDKDSNWASRSLVKILADEGDRWLLSFDKYVPSGDSIKGTPKNFARDETKNGFRSGAGTWKSIGLTDCFLAQSKKFNADSLV